MQTEGRFYTIFSLKICFLSERKEKFPSKKFQPGGITSRSQVSLPVSPGRTHVEVTDRTRTYRVCMLAAT